MKRIKIRNKNKQKKETGKATASETGTEKVTDRKIYKEYKRNKNRLWNWDRKSNRDRKIYKNIREIRTDCGTGTEKVTNTGKFTRI